MEYKKQYKVMSSVVKEIRDVEARYGDKQAAVRIIQPLSAQKGVYLNMQDADSTMFDNSLKDGHLKSFIDKGLIKIVYIDDAGIEISEEAAQALEAAENKSKQDSFKLIAFLSNSNIDVDTLIAALKQSQAPAPSPIAEPAKPDLIVTKEAEVIGKSEPEVKELSEEYKAFAALKYQGKLDFIKDLSNKELMEEIIKNVSNKTIKSKAAELLSKLG